MKNFLEELTAYEHVTDIAEKGRVVVLRHRENGRLVTRKRIEAANKALYEQLIALRHENLVQILAMREEDGHFYTYEEYAAGKTLAETLAEGTVEEGIAVDWITQLCGIVAMLHEQNPPIVHRDLKPSNIILSEGVVKLIDFNAAKSVTQGKERDTELMGTPGYAAPEQYGYGASDARTDIYAIGRIFEELLGSGYTGRFRKIIKTCLEIDPKNRYASVAELQRQLSPPKRKPLWAAALCLAAVLGVAFSAYAMQQNAQNAQNAVVFAEGTLDFTVSDSAELMAVLAAIEPEAVAVIRLANTIDHVGNIAIEEGEDITFDLTRGDLNITGDFRQGPTLFVSDARVAIFGGGELNLLHENFSPLIVQGGDVTVTNVRGDLINLFQGELTVLGDLEASAQLQLSQSHVRVLGDVRANITANAFADIEIAGAVSGDLNVFFGENNILVNGDVMGNVTFNIDPFGDLPINLMSVHTCEVRIGGSVGGSVVFADSSSGEDLRLHDDYEEIEVVDGREYFVYRDEDGRGMLRQLWVGRVD